MCGLFFNCENYMNSVFSGFSGQKEEETHIQTSQQTNYNPGPK